MIETITVLLKVMHRKNMLVRSRMQRVIYKGF